MKLGSENNNFKHGLSGTKFYFTWKSIKQRCNSENPLYGGRGIKNVWQNFQEFKENMFNTYLEHVAKYGEKNTSIDRIDVNGNYSKENCRWATQQEQANNKRSNIFITYKGKKATVTEWSKELCIKAPTLRSRIVNSKYDAKKAIEKKVKKSNHVYWSNQMNKWYVQMSINGQRKHMGTFATKEMANTFVNNILN